MPSATSLILSSATALPDRVSKDAGCRRRRLAHFVSALPTNAARRSLAAAAGLR
jgi:hypothetical protein